ncbi:unnamed protein product [Rotaria sp. Silwood1]|nr:unnamed protein product [Rotaria sp. Silwood1]
MSNITIVSTTAIALNLISLIGTIFIGLICIFILSMLLPSIVRQRDVVLILVVNNYLALLTFALIAIPMNIDMARGDYNLSIGMETFSCRVKGYLFYASIAIVFNNLTLQLKRFIRRTTTTISARSKRDLIVVQRTILILHVGKPIFYRLQYVIAVIVMIVLSFLFVLVTPQAKAALVCFHKPNKVTSLYEQQCVSASKAIKY